MPVLGLFALTALSSLLLHNKHLLFLCNAVWVVHFRSFIFFIIGIRVFVYAFLIYTHVCRNTARVYNKAFV